MATGGQGTVYTAADLQRYHSGLMNEAEMHALEKAALEDPFLSDALDGYAYAPTAEEDLVALKTKISERQEGKKVIPLFARKNVSLWRVAAAFLLISGVTYLAIKISFPTKNIVVAKKQGSHLKEQTVVQADPAYRNQGSSANVQSGTVSEQTTAASQLPSVIKEDLLAKQNGSSKSSALQPDQNDDQKNTGIDRTEAATDNTVVKKEIAAEPVSATAKAASEIQAKDVAASAHKSLPAESKTITRELNNARAYKFSGKILDEQGSPIPFATISDTTNKYATSSNTEGKFSIVSGDSVMPATIAALGYNRVERKLSTETEQTIVLSRSAAELNEVVVTGIGKKSKLLKRQASQAPVSDKDLESGVAPSPEPIMGMNQYNDYLKNNIKIPINANGDSMRGIVIVSFKVNSSGRPEAARIEKSLCDVCDAEALRLLKEGPGFKKLNNKRAFLNIEF